MWDYLGTYTFDKETISGINTAETVNAANSIAKKLIFRNCSPFTDWVSEINNTQMIMLKTLMWYCQCII